LGSLWEIALAEKKKKKQNAWATMELRGTISRLVKWAGMSHLLQQVYTALRFKGHNICSNLSPSVRGRLTSSTSGLRGLI
jgi:hypothetical protein